jgi:predicted LPLAT superfamily acyltransferase
VSTHWSEQRERGSAFAIELILWIARHLGRTAARLVLYPITGYFLLTARPQRRASRHYLQRVLPSPPGLPHIARHIHSFSATILDRVFFLGGDYQALNIELHNPESVLDAAASKQGAILLGSHLGSFEALRALGISHARIPLKVLMYPDHNQVIARILHRLKPEAARTLIPLGTPGTLLAVQESLRQGYLVGILGDRAARGEKTLKCRFLGAEAHFPIGPALLALATRVPIILFFALYRGGNGYEIFFEELSYDPPTDRRGRLATAEALTRGYVERLEHYARTAPYNWFNFYEFWENTRAAE